MPESLLKDPVYDFLVQSTIPFLSILLLKINGAIPFPMSFDYELLQLWFKSL